MSVTYGGQAVIEGVMMRGEKNMAVAVRRNPEEIVLKAETIFAWGERYRFLKWPFLRGFVSLLEALVLGVRTLAYSANQVVEEEGESITPWEMGLSLAFALGAGTVLFFLVPVGLAHLLLKYVPSTLGQNLLEGFFRVGIFLAYVGGIAFLPDIQRVFQYHGAEHKTLHMYEAGEVLSVENARKYSTLHPRCGTSFLLFVMVISIVVFSLCGDLTLQARLFSRILLLPLVAGVAYEFLKITGRLQDWKIMQFFSWPGLGLQKLTTREPDERQLEVAICALQGVLAAEQRGE